MERDRDRGRAREHGRAIKGRERDGAEREVEERKRRKWLECGRR